MYARRLLGNGIRVVLLPWDSLSATVAVGIDGGSRDDPRELITPFRPLPGISHDSEHNVFCANQHYPTWLEFAREMARLLGLEPRVTPVRMADMKLRASRPIFCALSNAKLRSLGIEMPTWQESLKKYLQGLGHEVAHEIADRQ